MADKKDDEYVLAVESDPDKAVYFQKQIDDVLQPRSREMFVQYKGVPMEELNEHIKEAQQRSFKIAPYSSIGAMTWLNPMILLHFAYPKVLDKVKNGASILDCACMIAQDLRQLAYDGASSKNMYGFDLEAGFFEVAYDFFKDCERFHGTFMEVDATKDFSETRLGEIVGKMDIIWCAKFIHIFDWDDQITMACKLVKLLKPQAGSMFVGSQNGFPGGKSMGLTGAGAIGSKTNSIYLNDVQHAKDIWKKVGNRTGLEFEVEATLLDLRTIGMHKDDGSDYKKTTAYNIQYLATIK